MSEPLAEASLLTSDAPQVSLPQVQQIAAELYGLQGTLSCLAGERDSNFRLLTANGQGYMLRFINAAEQPAEMAFQSAMLAHIALQDSALPVPRLVTSLQGETTPHYPLGEQRLTLRMVTYLPGTPQVMMPRTPALMRNLGDTLARMDLALNNFTHPGAERHLLWNLSEMPQLASWIAHLVDPAQREAVTTVLARYQQQVIPQLSQLRRQVIHNDLNPHNVLVNAEYQVTGIIDFGDALQAPLINELATALAYQLGQGDSLFTSVLPFVQAYHARLPLTDSEFALLPTLIACRLALTILIPQRRAVLYPQNRDYLLRNLPAAWRSLAQLMPIPFTEISDLFRRACQAGHHHQEP